MNKVLKSLIGLAAIIFASGCDWEDVAHGYVVVTSDRHVIVHEHRDWGCYDACDWLWWPFDCCY